MRLDFNVLWVEDQPTAVNSQIERIKTHMESEGFRFNPKMCTTMAEVESLIAGDVFLDEIDLILVDYDLGSGVHGQDVIERVREVVHYKDVIFYSANTTADLRRMVYERELEGVYCASRQELIEEFIGVFESLVKKVLDLDHTRGIVMGATSDIDHLVKTCLTIAHAKLDDNGKAKFITEALKRIEKKVKWLNKLDQKIRSAPTLEMIFDAHMLFTSENRLRMLAAVLDMQEFAAHSNAKSTIKSYCDDVVNRRNQLGHMILVPEGKPQLVQSIAGTPVSLDDMRSLRILILGLREDFRSLLDALNT